MKEMGKRTFAIEKDMMDRIIRESIASVTNGTEDDITVFYDPMNQKVNMKPMGQRDIQLILTHITRDESGNINDFEWDYDGDGTAYSDLDDRISFAMQNFNIG